MGDLLYRFARVCGMCLSVFVGLYLSNCNLLYSVLWVCIIFIIMDLYFPRIDFD